MIVNEDGFTEHNLRKAGYDRQPARGRLARRLPALPRADDEHDRARHRGHRGHHLARRRALQEPVRARPGVVDVRPADRADASTGSRRSSPTSRRSRDANLAAFRAGYNFGETAELFAVHYEVDAGARGARHLPQRQRHPGAGARPDRRERAKPASASSTPSYPITPASELLHTLSRHQPLRRAHGAGRGRDRRREHGARRRLRRPPGRDRHQRPGHGPRRPRRSAWRWRWSCRW